MRALLPLVVLSACTLGSNTPPVLRVPAPDPDQMSSETLDKQDPGADTSKNPEYRSGWSRPGPFEENLLGCLSWMKCDSGGRGDASGLLLVGAIAFALRRRNTRETRCMSRS